MTERIELRQPVLGLRPYVLLELRAPDEDDQESEFVIDITAGGGIVDVDLIRETLTSALENLGAATRKGDE